MNAVVFFVRVLRGDRCLNRLIRSDFLPAGGGGGGGGGAAVADADAVQLYRSTAGHARRRHVIRFFNQIATLAEPLNPHVWLPSLPEVGW